MEIVLPSFFNPNLLPWWGWLLCSAGAAVVALMSAMFDKDDGGWPATLVAVYVAAFGGLFSLLAGATGVILFVNSVWAS